MSQPGIYRLYILKREDSLRGIPVGQKIMYNLVHSITSTLRQAFQITYYWRSLWTHVYQIVSYLAVDSSETNYFNLILTYTVYILFGILHYLFSKITSEPNRSAHHYHHQSSLRFWRKVNILVDDRLDVKMLPSHPGLFSCKRLLWLRDMCMQLMKPK